ncbi:MOSC domain-containing protein [Sphingomonas sp. AR_OL41]|uniref:MOSC domain-containing protein n=1 Tax=Sphingomonas sp. AR_OL41 TaxID=3042729 RepID=UPI0024807C3C|nr:MOSC domain-containing protein [Sphingomonas sp. AR_OL41]MDH7972701.1 MOSC domain-containing protein [Sphingomonas sp. AR_OL41]
MIARIASLQVGKIAPLGPDAVPSGFIKQAVAGPVAVGPLGLDRDAQADLSVHGGPEKAVYGYAASHYPVWAADFPTLAERFVPGSMGENLTIAGIDESDLCVGDVHAIGTALLQLCQPRQPCFKLALALGEARLGKAMVRSGRSGWYYRVLRGGSIAPGDTIALAERPTPDFPFPRLVEIVNRGGASLAELQALATMPGVASRIAAKARDALAS